MSLVPRDPQLSCPHTAVQELRSLEQAIQLLYAFPIGKVGLAYVPELINYSSLTHNTCSIQGILHCASQRLIFGSRLRAGFKQGHTEESSDTMQEKKAPCLRRGCFKLLRRKTAIYGQKIHTQVSKANGPKQIDPVYKTECPISIDGLEAVHSLSKHISLTSYKFGKQLQKKILNPRINKYQEMKESGRGREK